MDAVPKACWRSVIRRHPNPIWHQQHNKYVIKTDRDQCAGGMQRDERPARGPVIVRGNNNNEIETSSLFSLHPQQEGENGGFDMSLSSSDPHVSAAKVTRSRTSKVARIAREIVHLVERIDGPVPLNRIDERVPGFRAPHGPSWSYLMRHNTGEVVVWNAMTEAGYKALRRVLKERQVALQFVNPVPYIFEGVRLLDPAWQPVVLLPLRAANIDGPNWAFRVPPAVLHRFLSGPGADGRHRLLVPQTTCSTADRCWGF